MSGADLGVGAVTVRVPLPAVSVPPGDADMVRRHGVVLADAGTALREVAWRLQADRSAMTDAQHWCGTASVRYHTTAASHGDRLGTAGRVLQVAGQTCVAYAHSLQRAQGRAMRSRREAEALVRDSDALADACRRYEADRARALSLAASPVQAGVLFAGAGDADAELRRLHAWADAIKASAGRVATVGLEADRAARTAAREASQVFDVLATLTSAARREEARRRHDQLVESGRLPAEDGSARSRFAGLLDALRADVTGPLEMVGGLLGAGGHAGESWTELRSGLGRAVTHPGDLVGTVFDTQDAAQGDWGHWVGTVFPGLLLTAGTGGAFGVARGIRSAQVLADSGKLLDDLRRAQELSDLQEWARFRFLNEGRTTSRLVPGGGLIWHEAAGGHSLDRHVALDVARLRERLNTYRLAAASSFAGRYEAEQLVAEALDRHQSTIATWLGTDRGETSILVEMRRVVGTTVRKGSRFVMEGTRIKLVLVREPDSPVGYILLTAFPLP